MKSVSDQFSKDMLQAQLLIDVVITTFDLAKHELAHFHSKHPIGIGAKAVHEKVRRLGTTLEIYDGTFLSICAQYEYTVRNLIETYINQLNNRVDVFSDLPVEIKKWYPRGCSNIILNNDQNKFQHLTQESIISSIASCVKSSVRRPYSLIPEAFSYHDNNLRSDVIEDIFEERLGIHKIWQKLSRQTILSNFLQTTNQPQTAQIAREKLNSIITQRNNIIHRGRTFSHPGESVVRDTAKFLSVLVESVADVLTKDLAVK